nr:MFS transporter [Coxiella burnetii]
MYKERYSESYYHAIAEKDKIFKITLVISAFLSMIFLDQTAVGVTLASIQKELVLSASTIAWIMNAYMITLSAFLLLFARLSDSIGIKNLFCAGILIFLLASLGCAVSNSGAGLIINRGLQGIGASMGYATYLLIFNNQVPANKRGKVLGTSAAFAAVFLALGPLIGGFFSNVISWRYLFWLNVPICLVCFYFAISACNKDSHPVNHAFLDKLGLLIYLFAMTGLIFFLMEGPTLGWTNPAILISLISSLLFFTLFVYHEKRQRQPLIEMALFKNKEFFASVLILFGNYACITIMAFWALWIEQVLGYSPLMTGVALLPAGVPYILTSRIGGALYDRYGPRLPLLIGSILFLVGLIEMALVATSLQYLWFLVGMLLVGLGWGFVRPCAILSSLHSVAAPQKSMATGVISTMRQLGAAVGFALVYAVISTYQHFSLLSIIQRYQLNLSTSQLNYLMTHSHQPHPLTYLIPLVNTVRTRGFSLGLLVISSLALLNLVLAIKYLKASPQNS